MEVDKYGYLTSLPLDKVKEIHLSTPGMKDGKWRDFHEEPSLEVYELLGFIKKRLIGNPYLVLEYYKSLSALREIYESLDSYSSV